jgi:hypothetical protein
LPLFRRRAASHTPMPSCTSTFMRLADRRVGWRTGMHGAGTLDAVRDGHCSRRHARLGACGHDMRFELSAVNSPASPPLTEGYGI